MICLYVQAPFAVFRIFATGSFRSTAGFITPSAAYGLVLNIAGIESRFDDGTSTMTLTTPDLPQVKIALAALCFPDGQSLYQQNHNYPVGKEAGARYAPLAKGNKYNITPVRKEFLSNLQAYVCIEGNSKLEQGVRDGLAGRFNGTRYGLPFLGDNNFMIDVLREETDRQAAYWYEKVSENDSKGPRPRTTRLTLTIDRQNMAKTTSALFSPGSEKLLDIPESAWVTIPSQV